MKQIFIPGPGERARKSQSARYATNRTWYFDTEWRCRPRFKISERTRILFAPLPAAIAELITWLDFPRIDVRHIWILLCNLWHSVNLYSSTINHVRSKNESSQTANYVFPVETWDFHTGRDIFPEIFIYFISLDTWIPVSKFHGLQRVHFAKNGPNPVYNQHPRPLDWE